MNIIKSTLWIIVISLFVPSSIFAQTESSDISDVSEQEWDDDWEDEDSTDSSIDFYGFVESAYGRRLQDNPAIRANSTLNDVRNRSELNVQFTETRLNLSGDLLYDHVIDETDLNLRTGFIDYSLTEHLTFRIGRQILTWGTGDYLFLNDLFPKDWQSFFSGRDDEYLKAPSDSVKGSWYFKNSSLQLVWTPEFEHDKYINGERFSFFSPITRQTSNLFPSLIQKTSETWSLKYATSINSIDYALYAYKGYWTTPTGLTPQLEAYFPKLNVYGASVQSPLGIGLINTEIAWYNSIEDKKDVNPLIPNSQFRALIGYEQEVISNLTFSAQYYLEHTKNYAQLQKYSTHPEFLPEKNRQVATIRLRWLTLQQKLTLNFFAFWSPTDQDAYIKPNISYRYNDKWLVTAGLNLFTGSNNHSFFGQHQDNSNIWFRIRYHY